MNHTAWLHTHCEQDGHGRYRQAGHAGSGLRRSAMAVALSVAVLGVVSLPAWAQSEPAGQALAGDMAQSLRISAGDLREALDELAAQTDLQIMYPPELVLGKTTAGLSGRYTRAEALRQLLQGTGLFAEQVNASMFTLKRGNAPGPARTQASAASGQSRASASSAESAEVTEMRAMMVTGSRLRRTDYEGPSPVVSIDREQIERSGTSTVRELIGTLPQASVSIDESGSNSYLGSATVQLRGLSYGSTLILINGRRVNASSSQASRNFFDLNSIPLEAIDRVEILTDTASAIYGGDAIGGAVNFILRRGYEGAVVSTRYGTSYKGDATEKSASLLVGGSGERFEGLLMFEYLERDPLYSISRDLTSTLDFRRFGGVDRRSTISYPGNIYALPGTGNLPGLSSTFAGVPIGSNGIGLTPADFAATDGVLNRTNLAQFTALVPETQRSGVLATGRILLDSGISLFGEVMHSRIEQRSEFGPDLLSGGSIGLNIVPASNPFNPFGVDVGVDYRFAELGPRTNAANNLFTRVLLGAEGRLGDLDWEVSLLNDRDESTVHLLNYINAAVARQYLASTDPNVALNVFSSNGNNNPATLDAIRNSTMDRTQGAATMVEATLSGGLDVFAGRRLAWALGASTRRETVDWNAGGIVLDVGRDIKAAFVEAVLPLMPDNDGRRLELSFAGRYDDYSDFGGDFNPQFGLLWKPVPSLLLRASAGTAFKTPSMFDLYAPMLEYPSATINDPLRNGELVEYELRMGGNPQVMPENAESFTAGFIFEPSGVPGLSVGANVFRVKQENFITRFFDYQLMLRNADVFSDRVRRAAPTAEDIANGLPGRLLGLDATTLNFGQVTVEGVDIQGSYAFDAGSLGSFVWTVNGSYVDSFKVILLPGDAPTEQVGRANRAGYPVRFKGNTGLQWSGQGGLSASVVARYLHSYQDYDTPIRTLPAQWWFDVQASYDFGRGSAWMMDGLSATLGAINVGNNQGKYSNSFTGYDFQQADLRGRFFYLNLKYAF